VNGNLRAGVARTNITPPVGIALSGFAARKSPSSGLHDALEAKALFLDDGRRRFAVVTADLIGLPRPLGQELLARLQKECGLDRSDAIIACSHTHSGPNTGGLIEMGKTDPDYVQSLLRKLVAVTAKARENAAPAAIGAAIHPCAAELSRNRVFGERGPVDRDIGVLKIVSAESAKPLAVLVNYACHAVVLGAENLQISADYPGALQRTVEEAEGALCLFANGACGDINPAPEMSCQASFEPVEKMGAELGREVLKRLDGIATTTSAALSSAATLVNLPFAEENAGEAGMAIRLKALAINDIVLLAIPAETFVEVALAIKQRCASDKVFVIGYADYVVGYIPTPEDFGIQGYASTSAPHYYNHPIFRSDVAEIVAESALKLADRALSSQAE